MQAVQERFLKASAFLSGRGRSAVGSPTMDRKILLIDDSAILRRIAINVLDARAGCDEVITATRATEGFARACATGAGLILVDYQIAGFPKAELCQRLLAEPRTSRVPVILLLGPGMAVPPRGSLPPNVVDHLIKPFTPEQLLSTVRNVFGGSAVPSPIRRLAETAQPPAARLSEVLEDHHEVALALSTAAVARRETGRFTGARRAVRPTGPTPATAAHDSPLSPRPADIACLRNALATAAGRRKTGVLRVHVGAGATTEIYLETGQIVVVATRDARRYSENADSVVPPKVSPATLESAVAEQAQSGMPFVLALGSRGLLSKSAAVSLLQRFGQRHFARLWAEPAEALTFAYEALDALPGFALRLEPQSESVDEWMFEAARHLQTSDIAAALRHEGLGGVPRPHHAGSSVAEALSLNEREREFLRLVDGRRNLATLAANLGVAAEEAFLTLYRFRCLAVMEYRPAGSAFVVTPRTSVRRVLPLQR